MNCVTLGCPPPRNSSRRCHCGACHESFSGLSAFDKHQTINHGSHCHDPADRGLIQRPDGVWRLPGEMPDGVFPPHGDAQDGLAPADLGAGVGSGPQEAQEAEK